MLPAQPLWRLPRLPSCSLWNKAVFQVWKAQPGLCLKGSLQSLPLWRFPLVSDLSIRKAQCPAFWDTSYCRQLEHTNVDHTGAQKTFPVMEEWGISLEHLSDANKFYKMRKCQDISPKPPRDHSCTLTGPEFPNPPPNSDLSPSHEVIKQEKKSALLNSWSHLEPDTLPSLWSL